MKKYTEIGQFRNVVNAIKETTDFLGFDENNNRIYEHRVPYPTLSFRGTVKTHGTNASICKYSENRYVFQSREHELSLNHDNCNFMTEMLKRDYRSLFNGINFNNYCCIYGEWVGKSIQKNVAVSELPKTFIIFAIKIDDVYHDIQKYQQLRNHADRIYNVLDFKYWDIDIDFNYPNQVFDSLMALVHEVENECPVGKYFGISGIGEGIVFEHITEKVRYIFKLKGEKHSGKPKDKTPKILSEEDKIKNENIKNVVRMVTPTWRLSQMLEKTFDLNNGGYIDREKLGDYLRNVVDDIVKEESDILIEYGLTIKDISKYVSNVARVYFFDSENEL